jgi:hypothetical protein
MYHVIEISFCFRSIKRNLGYHETEEGMNQVLWDRGTHFGYNENF